MKKILSLTLISALLLCSAASCSSSPDNTAASSEASVTSSHTEHTQTPAEGENPSEIQTKQSSAEESSTDDTEDASKDKEPSKAAADGEGVDASWFDDAVFVGDSITVGLYNYAENGSLGDAEFLAKQCMGFYSVMAGTDDDAGIHPEYRGELVMVEDAIQEIGKKKVFIMLGMNDICFCGPEATVNAMLQFTDNILEKNPDVTFYIQTVTPMLADKVRDDYLNNDNIAEYNRLAKQACEEKGYYFLDIASVMDDGAGNLREDYCSDGQDAGFHFNNDGITAWVDYLKTHVQG